MSDKKPMNKENNSIFSKGKNDNSEQSDSDSGFVEYQLRDQEYRGAIGYIDDEMKKVGRGRGKSSDGQFVGLALSGGGIRSATFSLGVLQALSKSGWLEKIDYLSTVSGGGYIGSSLTWLLSNRWVIKNARLKKIQKVCAKWRKFLNLANLLDRDNNDSLKLLSFKGRLPNIDQKLRFDVKEPYFPFGTQPKKENEPSIEKDFENGFFFKNAILRYLRQNGNYLAPGRGITLTSLAAAFLRGIVVNILFYFPLITGFFLLFSYAGLLKKTDFLRLSDKNLFLEYWNVSFSFVVILSSIFIGLSLIYSFITYKPLNLASVDKLLELRKWYDCGIRYILWLIGAFLILGLLPIIDDGLKKFFEEKSSLVSFFTGLFSVLSGIAAGVGAFFKSGEEEKGKIPLAFWTWVGSFLLIFGAALLGYKSSTYLIGKTDEIIGFWNNFIGIKDIWFMRRIELPKNIWVFIWLLLVWSFVVGKFTNLNYFSVHQYYRDRLMDAYMPDVSDLATGIVQPSSDADQARLSQMWKVEGEGRKGENKGPYHIINANVVLVDSKIPKFKGRGGDNFILSPLYCGSSATGWQKTVKFMGNNMTLPTAMAVSGAAVNPNTGVGGDGVTRNPMLSLIMTLLNLKLGYWAPNPDSQKWYAKNCLCRWFLKTPNFIVPQLAPVIPHFMKMDENFKFLQLTDGGHFENLGIYELIRRKMKIIIVSDGANDGNFTFGDFGNAVEKIRVDFGVKIKIDLKSLIPRKQKNEKWHETAEKGYAIGTIKYSDTNQGVLIYLKTTFIDDLPDDLVSYKHKNPAFPDESTADQFFSEKQFEAYRELGYQITQRMIASEEVLSNKLTRKMFEV
jgi:patatin-like phospholipase